MLYTDIKVIENRVENKMFYATVCYVMLLRESYDMLLFVHAMVLSFNVMVWDFNDMLCYSVHVCCMLSNNTWMNCLYYTSLTWSKKTVYNKEFYAVVKQL